MLPALLSFMVVVISLKLAFSGIPGLGQGSNPPLFAGRLGVTGLSTSGIAGINTFAGAGWPDGAGSAGKAGNSGDAGMGNSGIDVTGKSRRDCFGKAGVSGAPGMGISGRLVPIPNIVGWLGVFTTGEVVEIAAKTGICTGGAGGNATGGISLRLSETGLSN